MLGDIHRVLYEFNKIFNRISFIFFTSAGFLIASYWIRSALWVGVGLPIALWVLYLRTEKAVQELQIKRTAPKVGREREQITITYEIRNLTKFSISHLTVVDEFTGCSESRIRPVGLQKVGGLSITEFKHVVRLDAGMGTYHFGPIRAIASDALGFFQFVVTQEDFQSFETLPDVQPLDGFKISESFESQSPGERDLPIAGHAVNILKVRDYLPGDPVTRVHWKLTAKHKSLIVKEFEKISHTNLTLAFDLAEHRHLGFKSNSSWELGKDICVSILGSLGAQVDQVQFLSQPLSVPFNRGAGHLSLILGQIPKIWPVPDLDRNKGSTWLEHIGSKIPFGSSLMYITVFFEEDEDSLKANLDALLERGIRVTLILMHPVDFLAGANIESKMLNALGSSLDGSFAKLKNFIKYARQMGAHVLPISQKASLAKQLLVRDGGLS